MKKHALVAQSGGPSPVINASLLGVFEACRDFPDAVDHVFAAWHGVEGILFEQLIDLSRQDPAELARLRHTPAAGAIGTCRYKLAPDQAEDFDRIVDVIAAHDIGYFFYIGGNDSMDTASRVSRLAAARGMDLRVAGVPKTIDNDLGDDAFTLIDHTPGYGSCARFWASVIQTVEEENRGMGPSECVSVLQAMGRRAGFIPAAARLADPQRDMPLQIYTAESGLTLPALAEHVNRSLKTRGRCIVVVSEGFDVGALGEKHDAFGHVEYGASETTVAQVVTNYLNRAGFPVRGQATGQVPGVLQRCTSLFASPVDITEAYEAGRQAVAIAVGEGGGWMATLLREPGDAYRIRYDKVPLDRIANSVRLLPRSWLTPDGIDVTDDFVRYAQPLIGDEWARIPLEHGLQRFARLRPEFVERRCPAFVPVGIRTTSRR